MRMANGELLQADTWEEMWQLICDKMPKNCISCKWGSDGKMEKASRFIFCTHMEIVDMIDLMMVQGCARFESGDNE